MLSVGMVVGTSPELGFGVWGLGFMVWRFGHPAIADDRLVSEYCSSRMAATTATMKMKCRELRCLQCRRPASLASACWFGVWGLGFGVWGLGFGVWGLGFGVWGLGLTWLRLMT